MRQRSLLYCLQIICCRLAPNSVRCLYGFVIIIIIGWRFWCALFYGFLVCFIFFFLLDRPSLTHFFKRTLVIFVPYQFYRYPTHAIIYVLGIFFSLLFCCLFLTSIYHLVNWPNRLSTRKPLHPSNVLTHASRRLHELPNYYSYFQFKSNHVMLLEHV